MPADTPAQPIIRAQRIYLRPAERADLPTFVRWFSDAETIRYLSRSGPDQPGHGGAVVRRLLERQGKSDYHFVICLLDDGRPIGTAGLHGLDLENGHAEFGIAIGEQAEWNKGYGTEALQALTDFGFGTLRLERIELHVYEPNERARAFLREGGVRAGGGACATPRSGRAGTQDVLVMSQLRQEWLALDRPRAWELNR